MSFFRCDIFRHVQRSFWQKISTVLSGDEFNTNACSKCSKIVNSSSCWTFISCLSFSLLRNVEDVPGICLNEIELADGPAQLENGSSNHKHVKFVFLRCLKQLRGCKGHFVRSINHPFDKSTQGQTFLSILRKEHQPKPMLNPEAS